MTRQAITPAMKVNCLLARYDITCAICGEPVLPETDIEWDHVHALVHDGKHSHFNLRPLHADCHKIKTKADIQANCKIKRILADKPSKRPMVNSGRKIPSRPFPKGFRQAIDSGGMK